MNPILLYPKDATQAKFFRETAESKGMGVTKLTKRQAEIIDDILFGESIMEGMKTPKVSREQIFKTLGKCK